MSGGGERERGGDSDTLTPCPTNECLVVLILNHGNKMHGLKVGEETNKRMHRNNSCTNWQNSKITYC